MEVKIDKRERETRRKNIVIKGVKEGEGKEYVKEVEKIWEKIGIEGGREKMIRVGEVAEEGGIVWIELAEIEKKGSYESGKQTRRRSGKN